MTCPACNADLTGAPVPFSSWFFYGRRSHFSRAIPIYERGVVNASHSKCPDCQAIWRR